MKKTGFVGWRGMVGSVLMERMREESDFKDIQPIFFTTSQAGQKGPDVGVEIPLLQSAYDIEALAQMDVIVTCQGAITPNRSIHSFAVVVGKGIGLMLLQHCVWKKILLLFWIL